MPERDLETEPEGKDPKKAGGGGAIGDRAGNQGRKRRAFASELSRLPLVFARLCLRDRPRPGMCLSYVSNEALHRKPLCCVCSRLASETFSYWRHFVRHILLACRLTSSSWLVITKVSSLPKTLVRWH